MRETTIRFKAIGHVENYIELGTLSESVENTESRVILDPELVPGLSGLEPSQRVFSLRSPRRPNPIGIIEVTLVAIEGSHLLVKNLDAINGTPVLDLKPA